MAKTVTIGGRDTGRTGSGSGGGKSGGGIGLVGKSGTVDRNGNVSWHDGSERKDGGGYPSGSTGYGGDHGGRDSTRGFGSYSEHFDNGTPVTRYGRKLVASAAAFKKAQIEQAIVQQAKEIERSKVIAAEQEHKAWVQARHDQYFAEEAARAKVVVKQNIPILPTPITQSELKAKGLAEIIIATQKKGHAKVVNLDNNQLSTTEIYALMNELSHVDLDLDIMSLKNTGISNFTPCHIFTSLGLGRFHKITHLIISSNNLSDTAASLLGRILTEGKMSSTKTIDISNNKITDVGVKYFTDALQSDTVNNLEYLNLSNNKITDKGASAIAEALEYGKSNNLLKFDISGNNITEAGWEYFATAVKKVEARTVAEKIILQTMENERILTLDKISLKNIDMQHLADTLKPINYNLDAILLQNKNLNNLNFFHLMNGITLPNIGISHSVVYINLANNNLGDDAAQIISNALVGEQLTATRVIDVSGNKITQIGDTKVVQALKAVGQDIAIFTHTLDEIVKMSDGSKEEKIAIFRSIIAQGKALGTYDEAIVIDKSWLGSIEHSAKSLVLGYNQVFGFGKCHLLPEPEKVAESYAQDKIIATLPLKTASGLSFAKKYVGKLLSFHDVVTCFVSSHNDGLTSTLGQEVVKHELCLLGEEEFCGE